VPVDYLPDAVLLALPALSRARGSGEARADCANCVMVPPALPADHPRAFSADTRCCTYYPDLPNFLIGRALRRGEDYAAVLRRQLTRTERVSAWGLEQPEDVLNPTGKRFGRELGARCPYYAGGDLACGIWHDRNAVCRSWFCRYDDGKLGRRRWLALRDVLEWLETAIANLCVEAGEAPEQGAAVDDWAAFFVWCAERVDVFSAADVDELREPVLDELIARWQSLVDAEPPALPDVVTPTIARSASTDGGLVLEGYSSMDWVDVDARALELFVAMDGKTPWRDAVAATPAEARVTEALVRDLHRIDILRVPAADPGQASDQLPERLVPATALPITCGERVWIQGASHLGSVFAPRSVFELLSRLDGDTPWREALAAARARDPALSRELVAELFRIGALAAAE